MKKTNITLSRGIGASPTIVKSGSLLQSLAFFILCLLSFNPLQAQTCALSCQGANVSVDMDCSAMITTSMIADTGSCASGTFVVYVMTLEDDTLQTSPLVEFEHLGQTLKVSVRDEVSGNSCWAFITIEDKMPPMITCADDTINCTDLQVLAPPVAEDNCTIGTVTMLDEDIEALCDSAFIKSITQKFTATDLAGNTSDTCTQTLTLRRIDFSGIVWPNPWSIATNNAISCTAPFPDVNNDGNPDPLPFPGGGTGVPTINNVPIYPDFNFICNSATTFEDVNISPLNCVRKIMRMWTVREWHCDGERDTTFLQLIEIVDEEGPNITCPANEVDLTTTFLNCDASYLLPVLEITDDCSEVSLVTVSYTGGFANSNGGFQVSLPVGENLITYTAYDECLNSNECVITVNVADNTPPVPVCDQHTIIALTGYEQGGLTLVPAEVFDDGSYDECGDVTFKVQRMTSCINFDWTTLGAGIDNTPNGQVNSADRGTSVRSKVPLACCDIANDPFMIALIVTDESGNSNSCMVEIEVQDKLKPIIDCPSDIRISCEFDYDLENLSIFGDIVTSEAERMEFCVFDPANPDNNGNNGFTCGLDGLALDNCELEIIPNVNPQINNCGVGYINRTFIARDPNGSSSCTQRITVINFDPLTTNDIIWPLDYTGAECGLGTDPGDLPFLHGFPRVTEDECDLVGMNYEDQIFEFVEGACFKILRTWRVIEWCLYEEAGQLVEGENYWERTQIIKVQNQFGPEFSTEQPIIDECNDLDCGGLTFTLTQRATDDCTPADELEWSYEIDLYTNDTLNVVRSGSGGTIEFTRNFPIGLHKVLFTFEDKCGNRVSKSQVINVESCKAPQPVCISGLSTDLMTDGTVRIWASDFDASSAHPCGLPVTVSFSEDVNDIYRDFNCSHFGVGEVPVRLYAHDSNGLFAYCTTYIIIQDNMNVCDGVGGGLASIGGTVNTESTLDVAEVEITLEGSNMLPVVTNANGTYTFPAMVLGGTYDIMPKRDGDDKNGVSTLDLVRIQKHLLGLQPIQSPYLMIAADANNSKSVSAIDLIELRKLILGIYDELPSNDSWRFVESQYAFPDPFNPWFEAFPESYHLNTFNTTMSDIDFVAIKVGDLNNSVVANASQIVTRNAGDALTFNVENQKVTQGEIVQVDMRADQFNDLQGFQFTMGLNKSLEFVSVQSGAIEVANDQLGLNRLNEGMLTMSWFNLKGQTVAADDVLFTMTFKANKSSELSSSLNLNSDVTTAEAYNTDEFTFDVALEVRGGNETAFELLQNKPNPFNQSTKIAFNLPKASSAVVTVYDATGKQLIQQEIAGVKGYNELVLNRNQLSGSGIMFYQLSTDGYTASRKMVVLD